MLATRTLLTPVNCFSKKHTRGIITDGLFAPGLLQRHHFPGGRYCSPYKCERVSERYKSDGA